MHHSQCQGDRLFDNLSCAIFEIHHQCRHLWIAKNIRAFKQLDRDTLGVGSNAVWGTGVTEAGEWGVAVGGGPTTGAGWIGEAVCAEWGGCPFDMVGGGGGVRGINKIPTIYGFWKTESVVRGWWLRTTRVGQAVLRTWRCRQKNNPESAKGGSPTLAPVPRIYQPPHIVAETKLLTNDSWPRGGAPSDQVPVGALPRVGRKAERWGSVSGACGNTGNDHRAFFIGVKFHSIPQLCISWMFLNHTYCIPMVEHHIKKRGHHRIWISKLLSWLVPKISLPNPLPRRGSVKGEAGRVSPEALVGPSQPNQTSPLLGKGRGSSSEMKKKKTKNYLKKYRRPSWAINIFPPEWVSGLGWARELLACLQAACWPSGGGHRFLNQTSGRRLLLVIRSSVTSLSPPKVPKRSFIEYLGHSPTSVSSDWSWSAENIFRFQHLPNEKPSVLIF